MNNIKLILAFGLLIFWHNAIGQTEDKKPSKWSLSAEIGLSTNSTKSDYSRLTAPNYSIGIIRKLTENQRFATSLQAKISVYTEVFNDLPYYYLDGEQNLISKPFSQVNSYSMIYIGYSARYFISPDKYFINAAAGFNFIPISIHNRKIDNGNGSGKYYFPIPPMNIFVNRPELSLGFGFKKTFGTAEFYFIPKYMYNFTIGSKNLIPSFSSVSLEIIYKL